MSTNYTKTGTLKKDLNKLVQSVDTAAKNAVAYTVEQQSAFEMSFDETEVVPFVENANGRIVVSVTNSNPATLDDALAKLSSEMATVLSQRFAGNMKGVIK